MVINVKEIVGYPLYEYDPRKELELLDDTYCLPTWYYSDYQWTRYKRRREKLLREIKVNVSESLVECHES